MALTISITRSESITSIALKGRLDAEGGGTLWNNLNQESGLKNQISFDLTDLDHLDMSGSATLYHLKRHLLEIGAARVEISNFNPEHEEVFRAVCTDIEGAPLEKKDDTLSFVEHTGQYTVLLLADIKEFITFTGQIAWAGMISLKNPGKIRWTDTFIVAEMAGINALPIVALISFIVGLVMAFQAAIPMRMFGAELYVANLIGIAMVRELGPLMTAIVLAGRSASAFAAEIGTMRINEEIDALNVMGVDPMRFLIIPRIIAATLITPLLTIFSNLMGMIGGALVITSLGYPIVSYYNQIADFVKWNDFAGGLVKCFVFGLLIAATGCIRGYQTQSGPSAVGVSTTRAVVTSIVLIAVFDGIFSIIYYYLGI